MNESEQRKISNVIIDENFINKKLNEKIDNSPSKVKEILAKAREMKGIDFEDVLTLLSIKDQELNQSIYETASFVKNEIYGKRLVLFAPLYISNLCKNECLYCAFRNKNNKLKRKALQQEEIKRETEILVNQGHKRVLLVAGEDYEIKGLDYVLEAIDSVYSVKSPKGGIRRVNVNVAPLTVEEFKRLHHKNIGTYQIFQETYHRGTYAELHTKGPKSDYDYRLTAMDRAFDAGFDDVGVGVLFGLQDWRFEILALLSHIKHLEKNFGVGPHTISLPRMEPALNSSMSYDPPYPVSDEDFKKIIAVLRLAIPYTGLILSTRESKEMRRFSFELGVSQISAGSKTNPGGYSEGEASPDSLEKGGESQFSLGDTRSLHDVVEDIVDHGYIPSFCTGCYRLGRVGADFMDLAKPGLIKEHCLPNGLFTFKEYLDDFGSPKLKEKGMSLINNMIKNDIPREELKKTVTEKIEEIHQGKRDIYF